MQMSGRRNVQSISIYTYVKLFDNQNQHVSKVS